MADRDDPMLRMGDGDALARGGRTEDALTEYLWCFDHGLEHCPAFAGVRLSFLLSRILQLGRSYPPALDELRKRRDAAREDLEGGRGDFELAIDFTALNRELEEPDQTLALYDRIKANSSLPEPVRQYLFVQSLDRLLVARRYEEVIAVAQPGTRVRDLIADHERDEAQFPDDPDFRAFVRQQLCAEWVKYYEALVGVGERSGAAGVASLLVAFDPADAYPALIAAARRAGDDEAAEALAEEASKVSKVEASSGASQGNHRDQITDPSREGPLS